MLPCGVFYSIIWKKLAKIAALKIANGPWWVNLDFYRRSDTAAQRMVPLGRDAQYAAISNYFDNAVD
jgi:hypothetical protein